MLQFNYSAPEIDDAAARLLAWAGGERIWTFSGTLGAGKTTFISAICRQLGIADPVSSPTFSLINEYALPAGSGPYSSLMHMDWYRVRDAEEAIHSGLEDALHQPGSRSWIEWPERAPELLEGLRYVRIHLEAIDVEARRLEAELVGAVGRG